MASLTIRKLDEGIKAYLRLRSAKQRPLRRRGGPGDPARDHPEWRRIRRPSGPPRGRPATYCPGPPAARTRPIRPRVTLIIGGGIAAYKALDLIRRLKERQIRRPLRADPCRAAIRHAAAASALSHERGLHRPVRSRERVRCRPHPPRARLRSDRGGAGDRRSDGEDGAGPCRRSRQRHPARGGPTDPAGAGDESADVEQCRDPPQCRAA